jgi:RNA polymerase sigma-70 factor, ECF subfamily
VVQYESGNTTAFEEIYRRHRDPLYRYFLRGARSEAAAADLFQECWAAVVRARTGYRPTARFAAWLYRIAHSKLVDHVRSRTDAMLTLEDTAEPAAAEFERPDRVAEAAGVAARLLRALALLPLEQRTAFLLREEGELSLEEIAEVTGVGRETVKSRLRYALAKLREELSDVRP